MVKQTFTKEMIDVISEMKGKNMVSYQFPQINMKSRTYGNFRINLEDYAIEFSNENKLVDFFDTNEEVAGFECKKVELKEKFVPYVVEPVQVVPIEEKVRSI